MNEDLIRKYFMQNDFLAYQKLEEAARDEFMLKSKDSLCGN